MKSASPDWARAVEVLDLPITGAELERRFMSKVAVVGDCLEWTGARYPRGYGQLRTFGRGVKASHIAYVAFGGLLEAGEGVCHTCDNPPCVRREHLFAGTQAVNVADMIAKGRRAPNKIVPPRPCRRCLTEYKPLRRGLCNRCYQRVMGGTTGVGQGVGGGRKGAANGRARLTAEQVAEIRSLVGVRQVDIAVRYSVGQSQVSRILRGEGWS